MTRPTSYEERRESTRINTFGFSMSIKWDSSRFQPRSMKFAFLKNGIFFFCKVTHCFHPGSNLGPSACKADVITTTLWKLTNNGCIIRTYQLIALSSDEFQVFQNDENIDWLFDLNIEDVRWLTVLQLIHERSG